MFFLKKLADSGVNWEMEIGYNCMKIIGIFVVSCKGVAPLFENHDQNDQRVCVEKSRENWWVFI